MSTIKQATSIKLATAVSHFFFQTLYGLTTFFFLCLSATDTLCGDSYFASFVRSMAYNKETEEIIAGGKGFVETWKLSGKEVGTAPYSPLIKVCQTKHISVLIIQ